MLFFPAPFLLQPPTVEALTLQTCALASRLKAAASHFGGFGAVTNDALLFFFYTHFAAAALASSSGRKLDRHVNDSSIHGCNAQSSG